MPVLNRIAHFQNRRDEVPNQELARDLAAQKDAAGIREIAENLWSKDKNVRADCIKVLYEIGYIDPSLVAEYVEDFIKLLKSSSNRLVWGGMIALGTVAQLKADAVYAHLAEIRRAMDAGSVITMDNGVQTLARTASQDEQYNQVIFPYLLDHLKTCRPKDVAQHAEKTLPAVNAVNKAEFISALEKRMADLSGSGLARVKKVIKEADKR
ncbi:MAG: hypothetical protein WA821_14165 [Anaerolineales bacterium]